MSAGSCFDSQNERTTRIRGDALAFRPEQSPAVSEVA